LKDKFEQREKKGDAEIDGTDGRTFRDNCDLVVVCDDGRGAVGDGMMTTSMTDMLMQRASQWTERLNSYFRSFMHFSSTLIFVLFSCNMNVSSPLFLFLCSL
jgi:hypothetical protein